MSTNVYNYDERWYVGEKPSVYHGWIITTSSDTMRIAHFKSRAFCGQLEKLYKAVLPDCVDHVLIAACLSLKRFGVEADWHFADELIKEEFERNECVLDDQLEIKLDEILDQFIG